jgi:MerR family mercuric resistance operon transcriptional regulator
MIVTHPPLDDLSIGQLASLTNCQVVTIRYYERIGMLPKPRRNPGGHPVYNRSHLERLGFIRKARELGFTQEAVRSLLHLLERAPSQSCADVDAITLAHLGDVRQKIEHLKDMERQLEDVLNRCGQLDPRRMPRAPNPAPAMR